MFWILKFHIVTMRQTTTTIVSSHGCPSMCPLAASSGPKRSQYRAVNMPDTGNDWIEEKQVRVTDCCLAPRVDSYLNSVNANQKRKNEKTMTELYLSNFSFERYVRICYYCQLRFTSLLTEENFKFYKLFLFVFPVLFYIPKFFEIRSVVTPAAVYDCKT
jgi:hypothetical protein